MINPNKKRLRRTMMFLNAQKPGLIKDPYIYKPDSIMLDLEDAVAENQKDAARFSLFHALRTINYRGCERVVRINGLDSPYWKEDIRCAVAGGCDSIRIPKTESAKDVYIVEKEVAQAEKDFGRPEGSVLIMAAIESARGVMRALDICEASERLFGIALSGGDYTKDLQTHITGTGLGETLGSDPMSLLLIEIAGNFGVVPAHIAIVMVVCRNCATFISPVVPATFLGIGLADVEIKDHIKNCFFWIWGVSIVCLLAGLLLGVIKI